MVIKKIMKSFFYSMIFIGFFLLFFPMKNLYFLLEKKLETQHIVLDGEQYSQKLYTFNIEKSNLYYNNALYAEIKNIDFIYLVFYNQLDFKNLELKKDFFQLPPMQIDFIKLNYNILSVTTIGISAKGEFGILEGNINLFSQEINLFLKPSSWIKNKAGRVLQNMKEKEGIYSYVYKY